MARPKLGEGETQRLQLKITSKEIEAIDDWRFAKRVASRSEAVRRLCKVGLATTELVEMYGRRAGSSLSSIKAKRDAGVHLEAFEVDEALRILAALSVLSAQALPYISDISLEDLLREDENLNALFAKQSREEQK